MPVYQDQGWASHKGWDWGQGWKELRAAPSPSPSPSPDYGFKSDQSSASTSSSVSSRSNRSEGSRHSHQGQWPHREPGGYMKINLPVFKDQDTKAAVTYQSWCWDLTMYHHGGAEIAPFFLMLLIPYKVTQGNWWGVWGWTLPWMTSSPYWMRWVKKIIIRLGVHLLRHLQVLTASFLEYFPPDWIAELKCDCFYGGLPKWLKAIIAYLKASTNERTYSESSPGRKGGQEGRSNGIIL